jgi:CBS domain-containing protein
MLGDVMDAGKLCTRGVKTATRELSVVDAAIRMRNSHVGDLVVIKDKGGVDFPIGMLTDRDIVISGVATRQGDVSQLSVSDIMTDVIVLVREEDDLETVLRTMRANGVRRVPVVGENDALVGIIAFDDIVGYFATEMKNLARVVSSENLTERRRRP